MGGQTSKIDSATNDSRSPLPLVQTAQLLESNLGSIKSSLLQLERDLDLKLPEGVTIEDVMRIEQCVREYNAAFHDMQNEYTNSRDGIQKEVAECSFAILQDLEKMGISINMKTLIQCLRDDSGGDAVQALTSLFSNNEVVVDKLLLGYDGIKEALQFLLRDVIKLKVERESLQKTVQNLENANESHQIHVKELEGEVSQLRENVNNETSKSIMKSNELKRMKDEKAVLLRQTCELTKTLEESNSRIASMQNEMSKLIDILNEKNDLLEELSAKSDGIGKEVRAMTEEKIDAKNAQGKCFVLHAHFNVHVEKDSEDILVESGVKEA